MESEFNWLLRVRRLLVSPASVVYSTDMSTLVSSFKYGVHILNIVMSFLS